MAAILLACAHLLGGRIGVGLMAVVLVGGLLFLPKTRPAVLLRFFRAYELEPAMAPGLHAAVAMLAARGGLPRPPALVVVNNPTVTAFSVGGAKDSAIGVSNRLLYKLDAHELEGIVAHEMSHIIAGDVTLFALSQVIARIGRALALAGFALFVLFGVLGGGPISLAALLLVCVAPLGMAMMQSALSRNREYDADRAAARLIGDPHGLAKALERIDADRHGEMQRFFSPFSEQRLPSFLRTHPPVAARVARLLETA
jgi:heat shock protein HtpX